MATMKDMWAHMIEKLTTQAAEVAVLKESKIWAQKRAEEKDYLYNQLINLRLCDLAKLSDALDTIESLAAQDAVEIDAYQENSLAFLEKWPATTSGESEDPGKRLYVAWPQLEGIAEKHKKLFPWLVWVGTRFKIELSTKDFCLFDKRFSGESNCG